MLEVLSVQPGEAMEHSELLTQLEELHGQSYAWSLRCCLGRVIEAEVALQNTYLKVLEGKARYHGKSSFKTWLFSVIRRTAADQYRRSAVRRICSLGLLDNRASSSERTLEDNIFRSEIQGWFRRALGSLPRRQQQVLQLTFYHDLSLAETALVMGISLGSVRTHYDRGKKQLRRWIEESRIFHESGKPGRRHQRAI